MRQSFHVVIHIIFALLLTLNPSPYALRTTHYGSVSFALLLTLNPSPYALRPTLFALYIALRLTHYAKPYVTRMAYALAETFSRSSVDISDRSAV